jgi:hypothetical protein
MRNSRVLSDQARVTQGVAFIFVIIFCVVWPDPSVQPVALLDTDSTLERLESSSSDDSLGDAMTLGGHLHIEISHVPLPIWRHSIECSSAPLEVRSLRLRLLSIHPPIGPPWSSST